MDDYEKANMENLLKEDSTSRSSSSLNDYSADRRSLYQLKEEEEFDAISSPIRGPTITTASDDILPSLRAK